jgi:hypothetical protein
MKSMATQKLTYVALAHITKVEKSEDGLSLKVFGKATDETLDGDGQKVDLEWAGKALAAWLGSGGNIRVQHNPALYPAGVGMELDVKSDGAYVTADIVEPTAMRLVEKRALSAYSIGIANPKVVRDLTAPHGRINGGQIVEVSLVDRPSNPSCGIKLMKAADGGIALDTWDENRVEKSGNDADDFTDDDGNNVSDAIESGMGDDSDLSPDTATGTGDSDDADPDNTDGSDASDQRGDDSASKAAAADAPAAKCKTCKGKGKIKAGHVTCPDCHGSGKASDVASKSKDNDKHGDQLGKSTRRSNSEESESASEEILEGGDHEDGKQAHGESGKSALEDSVVAGNASSDQSVQVEKLDLTAQKPVVTEVTDKSSERGQDGKFSLNSNPINHNPGHFDSTAPGDVVGGDTYSGQAEGTTAHGAIAATIAAVTQAQDNTATNGVSKVMTADRVAWFIGKSEVSTKPQREGAKFSMKDADGDVKYPINDCGDVSDAWKLRGSSSIDKSAVAAYVRKCAKKLGCPDPGAASDAKKAAKKMRKQAKLIKKLQKQAKAADEVVDERPTIEKWASIVEANKALAVEKADLEVKLEKISSTPTIGKAIRSAKSVRTDKPEDVAVAQKRAAESDTAERISFLEGIARLGSAEQQDVAQDMLVKLRGSTINKQA